MNRYVNGNPISYIDPFGLSADSDEMLRTAGSFIADAVPILGTVKGFQETITGVNYITGEQLSVADRVANGIGSLTGLILFPGTKYVGKYGTEAAIDAGGWALKQFGKNETKQVASKLPLKVNLQLFAGNRSSLRVMIENNAQLQLSRMESSTNGAHYYSRHGAQTTLQQQYLRATNGYTPDGYAGRIGDASKFLSNQIQLNTAQRAETIYNQIGRNSFSFDRGENIGEGYLRGGQNLVSSSKVTAVFRNGKLYILYPKLRN
ncbi:pre-toxin TG domain-containing protein [Paenibacillus sp. PsM32]|uniref:pre-toxin TG domain-containing protein n=1 Tax=Paenibacillus sp. PsM32 TaxID=3030536 RepID=UPI00263AD554|nr:pre-toxin TG domain-containing protein [Paenibacillus sp. PsM32]MDN4621054.1 pre-toxin TG domain-containing protein [Paenibacillus sp. PsM32]